MIFFPPYFNMTNVLPYFWTKYGKSAQLGRLCLCNRTLNILFGNAKNLFMNELVVSQHRIF